MAKKIALDDVSIERLRYLFDYDRETGLATRLVTVATNARVGDVAGSVQSSGHLIVWIDGRSYLVHRVVWAIHYGKWPTDQIDHVNGIKTDNRISNLREATHAENMRNRGMLRSNTSGVIGVCWHKASQKWQAYIRSGFRIWHLGLFDDLDRAAEEVAWWRKTFFGEFAPDHSRSVRA